MARIVVLGATGYTGRLVVDALNDQKLRPVLAGRNKEKLEALARKYDGLEWVEVDASKQTHLQSMLVENDVLITLVGPYGRLGPPIVEAAIEAGAHYVDVTGEIEFAREVIERFGPRAEAAGVMLHTTAGYDYVPGHCLAASILECAGKQAVRLEIGYFASHGARLKLSQGTRASLLQATLTPGVFWQNGQLEESVSGQSVRRFEIDGHLRPAVSISSTEHLFLPKLYPHLRDINVYLGWFGKTSYLMPLMSRPLSLLQRSPRITGFLKKRAAAAQKSHGEGPDEESRRKLGSHILGFAYDADDQELGRAELLGANGYDFTARYVARLAGALLAGDVKGRGAVDPISAWGVKGLVRVCQDAGLELSAR